jgi:hypothetical protein
VACVRYDHYPIHHRRASSVPSLFCAAFPVAQPGRASTTSPSRPAPASRALRPAWLLIQQVKWALSRGLDPTGQPVLSTDDYMGGRFRHPVTAPCGRTVKSALACLPLALLRADKVLTNDNPWRAVSSSTERPLSSSEERCQTRKDGGTRL